MVVNVNEYIFAQSYIYAALACDQYICCYFLHGTSNTCTNSKQHESLYGPVSMVILIHSGYTENYMDQCPRLYCNM